ncbi:MAG: hypothetical protein J7642_16290 [Cyanobacteria bacterium SBC]|nr:hypothetical protein [Cyanobacteria bacterium SBC]
MVDRFPTLLKKLTVSAGVICSLLALPIQAARAANVIWTVYQISFKCSDPGSPPPDYPGVGSR